MSDEQPTGKPSHLFKPGQSGNPKGRPKEPVFSRKQVMEICAKLNCNPIEILAKFANGDVEGLKTKSASKELEITSIPLKMRLAAAVELAGYLTPKLRAVEVSTQDEDPDDGSKKPKLIIVLPSNGRESKMIMNQPGQTLIDNDSGQVYEEIHLDTRDFNSGADIYDGDE
jgi:hypothetical protein